MPSTPFQPAYEAALKVLPHLARHLAAARLEDGTGVLPEVDTVASMIDAAFWASLRREEGYAPKISLAFVDPADLATAMRFDRPLPMRAVGSSRVDLQACKLEYSIVSPK